MGSPCARSDAGQDGGPCPDPRRCTAPGVASCAWPRWVCRSGPLSWATTCRRPRVGIWCWRSTGHRRCSPGGRCPVDARPPREGIRCQVQLSPTFMTSGKGQPPWAHSPSQPRCGGSAVDGAKPFGDALHAQMQLTATRAASALALVGFRDNPHGGLAKSPHSTIHVSGEVRGLIPDGAVTEPAVELGSGDRP